ncbi:MAG: DUF4105 domain-containing protein [Prevotella sp.]|nr:DUF4105 domain-containing protein [Prevotella sp.]
MLPLQAVKRLMQLLLVMLLSATVRAEQPKVVGVEYFDSVEVSLLTCAPHEEVYSLYGHTALRWHDLHTGDDLAFNWGIFNFKKPFFVVRFVFGLTDYELGITPFEPFAAYYRRWGAMVTEQVLNLTSAEKSRLQKLLADNYLPENRVYRYNYFYDNCSTRPRDIIERCLDGKVEYKQRQDYELTFRQMIHEKTKHHEWATEGNDLLLGLRADLKTSRQEQEFLPENLLYDFDRAQIRGNDGAVRPLVVNRRMAVQPGVQVIERDFVMSPIEVGVALLIVSLLVFAVEWRRRHIFIIWDVVLMALTGLAGCVLFVMLFSQHPCTTTNLQVLLLNPLHLFFIPSVVRRRPTRYWKALLFMTSLLLIGAFFQRYAVLTPFLALCLLTRYWIHLRREK